MEKIVISLKGKHTMTHWAHINIWPEELIQLNRELIHHPVLMNLLANHERNDKINEWEVKLAEIAVYCEVLLDGEYNEEELVKLCGILYKKLIERRQDNRGILVIT